MRIYLRTCVVVAGLTGFGFLLPAIAGQQPPTPSAVTTTPERPPLKVKVFRLERADPDSVMKVMHDLLEDPDVGVPARQEQSLIPVLVIPGFGFQFLNAGGGFSGAPSSVVPQWRVASDERIGAVIVRGSEKHLKVAADLVAILDRKPNTPIPQLQVVKAFALKHAEPEAIINVIRSLDLEDVRMSSLDDKTLLVIGPDDVIKTVVELVKELDVPDRPEPKDKALPRPNPNAGM